MASNPTNDPFELSDEEFDAVLVDALEPPALSPGFHERLRLAIAREAQVRRNGPVPEATLETVRHAWIMRYLQKRMVARAALLLGCVALVDLGSAGYDSYSTSIGGQRQVALPSGINTMKLNTNTKLRFLGGAASHVAILEHGEVFFQPTSGQRRTLEVIAGEGAVSDINASFSVRILPGGRAEVLVREGSVAVGKSRHLYQDSASQTAITIGPGEVALLGPDGITVQRPQKGILQRKLAWSEGKLTFAGESLQDAVAEFNRYNSLQLVIVDPSIRLVPIGAVFSPWEPETFAISLCSMKIHAIYSKTGNEQRILLYGQHRPMGMPGRLLNCPMGPAGSR